LARPEWSAARPAAGLDVTEQEIPAERARAAIAAGAQLADAAMLANVAAGVV